MLSSTLTLLIIILKVISACEDKDTLTKYSEGDRWLRNGNFLVECVNGEAKVVKCITDHGSQIDVGTERYYENGVEFSCVVNQEEVEGCLDNLDRQVPTGHFVFGKGLLKFCNIQQNGLKARAEPKGCFTGTLYDNPNDPQFHVKKYAVWRNGDKELRCGDNGIHLHRCFHEEKAIYTGTASILPNGSVFSCE